MKVLIVLSIFIYSQHLRADTIDCKKTFAETKKALKTIRDSIKIGKDIDEAFLEYEMGIDELIECPAYANKSELKVKDNEKASFRKFMHSPDRSANIPEADCLESSVPTQNLPKNSNQNQLSWCFAWPVADLISFHEEVPVSAYDVAFQYHNDHDVREYNSADKTVANKKTTEIGGEVHTSLKIALGSKGLCLESETNYFNGDWEKNSEFIKALSDSPEKFSKAICELGLTDVQPFKDIDKDVMDILNKLSSDKKVAAFMDLVCKKRHVVKNDYRLLNQYLGRPGVTKEKMMSRIDGLLDNNLPIAIGYDQKILDHGVNYQSEIADHASTLIGRKFNKKNGQCEYLIKNSWGTEVDCQHTSSVRCENGNYWVTRTSLKNNLTDIVWLEKKKPTPATETQK